MAVNAALTVISWHENLPREEQPPRHIWYSGEKVEEWFKNVEGKRTNKYGNQGRTSPYDDADDVPMTSNELVDSLRPS